jgi:hypothetical protein
VGERPQRLVGNDVVSATRRRRIPLARSQHDCAGGCQGECPPYVLMARASSAVVTAGFR